MMRTIVFLPFLLLFLAFDGKAQECYPFKNPPEGSPTVKALEKRFTGKDTSGTFDGKNPYIPNMKGLDSSYKSFVRELGNYLYDNGFEWDQRVRYFQRIYFEADGTVAYYLYEFRNATPKGERREQFEELVIEYLTNNELSVENKEHFVLCAPVVLRPKAAEQEE